MGTVMDIPLEVFRRILAEFKEILQERFELEKYGKRPNFLLFSRQFAEKHDSKLSQLMYRPDEEVEYLVNKAVLALEVEQSAWSVKRAERANLRLSFTVKDEDLQPLNEWLRKFEVPIGIFQVFVDELHVSPLEKIVNKGKLRRDPTTKKPTYFFTISPQTRLTDIANIYFDAKWNLTKKGSSFLSLCLKEVPSLT